jgi:hypothetical protein
MNALVTCRAGRVRGAVMVVLFGFQRVDKRCRKAEGPRDSAWHACGPVTCLLLPAGWRSWFEGMLLEGFLDAPGAGGSDALVNRQCLL